MVAVPANSAENQVIGFAQNHRRYESQIEQYDREGAAGLMLTTTSPPDASVLTLTSLSLSFSNSLADSVYEKQGYVLFGFSHQFPLPLA